MAFLQRLGQLRSPVSTYASLPLSSNVLGDVRLVTDTGDAYTWMLSETSGSLSDWKKVTTSSYNDLVGAPSSTGLAIDDAVKVVKALAINVTLLAFQTVTGAGAAIERMFDGMVNQFTDETGIETPSCLNQVWESSGYYKPDPSYHPTVPSEVMVDISSAPHTVTPHGSADMSGTNPLFGNASLYLDGINSYLSLADSDDWKLCDDLGGGSVDSSTKLLLHLDNNVTDSEITPKTVTNNGVTFSSSISKFGGYSGLFNGTGANLSLNDSNDWYFNSDFTIDLWVRFTDISMTRIIMSQGNNASNYWKLSWGLGGGGSWSFGSENGVGGLLLPYVNTPNLNQWYHVAVVRYGNVWTLYVYYVEKDLDRIIRYCEKDTLAVANLLLKYKGKEIVLFENMESV